MNTNFTVVRTWLRIAVAVAVMVTLLGSTLLAQAPARYIEDKPDAKLKTWNEVGKTSSDERRAIENMIKGTSALDDTQFSDFFNKVVFPQFTLAENIYFKISVRGSKDLKNTVCLLPAMRKDFNQIFFRDATQQARSKLNGLTLAYMLKIANGSGYHPIARYNAMLFIAELDQDGETETPYTPALVDMGRAAMNPQMIESVRVAALIGVLRHARSAGGIPDNRRAAFDQVLTRIVTDTKRPANRSREGHDWIRRRALEALTAMQVKTPPTDGKFLQLLSVLLQEKDSMMELRAKAIESFLTVTFPAGVNVDSAKMAADIGQVAVDAYHRELATSSQFGRAVDSKGMTYYYTLVERGLTALDKLAPSPKIAELQKSLATLVEEATAEEEVDPETQQSDPLFKERQFDKIAQSGAEFESLVTGKPVSEILPKRGPVGGNEVAAVGFQGGGGRGPGGVGYGPRTSGDRSGGHMRLPPGVGGPRGRGGYGLPSGGRR